MTTDFLKINKETEKAINLTMMVCWGNGKGHTKDLWLPKSCVKIYNDMNGHSLVDIVSSFARKICWDNRFNGYTMDFVNCCWED